VTSADKETTCQREGMTGISNAPNIAQGCLGNISPLVLDAGVWSIRRAGEAVRVVGCNEAWRHGVSIPTRRPGRDPSTANVRHRKEVRPCGHVHADQLDPLRPVARAGVRAFYQFGLTGPLESRAAHA
jgi:hypothetical protein